MTYTYSSWRSLYSTGNGEGRVGFEAVKSGNNMTVSYVLQYRGFFPTQQIKLQWGVGSANGEFGDSTKSFTRGSGTAVNTYKYHTYSTAINYGHTYNLVADAFALGTGRNFAANVTGTVEYVDVPDAPTDLSVTYLSDGRQTLGWTNHPTVAKPYDHVRIYRRIDGGSKYTRIAVISGTSTSYTDSSTAANHTYEYSLRADNTNSWGPRSTAATIATTPAPPSGVRLSRTASNGVKIEWSNNVPYSEYETIIEESDGGSGWNAKQTLGAGVTSWTDTSPGSGTTKYRLRAHTHNISPSLYSTYANSAPIIGVAPPLAPSALAPNNKTIDGGDPLPVTWQHNAQDGSDQTQYQTRHRLASAGPWIEDTAVTSSVAAHTFPAGTFPNRDDYVWQVRTWGADPSPGPYSSSATLLASTRPLVTIQTPTADPYGLSSVTVTWTYFQAESVAQQQWQAMLIDTLKSSIIEATGGNITGATGIHTFASVLENGGSYRIEVIGQSADGLSSTADTVSFDVDYLLPVIVDLDATYNDDTASVTLALTPQAVETGVTVAADTVDVYRSINADETFIGLAAIDAYYTAQITAVAGAPAGILTEPGSVALSGFGQYGGRALIAVYDVTAIPASGYANIAKLVNNANSGQADAQIVVGGNGISVYAQSYTINNASQQYTSTIGLPGDGRQVSAVSVNDGITDLTLHSNEQAKSKTLIPADGMSTNPDLLLESPAGIDSRIVAAWPVELTAPQRNAIMPLMKAWADARDAGIYTPPAPGPWVAVALGIDPDTTLIDTQPTIRGGNQYRLVIHSTIPTTRTIDNAANAPADARLGWLSGGAAFDDLFIVDSIQTADETFGKALAAYHFAGRKKPVMFEGDDEDFSIAITGILLGTDAYTDVKHLRALISAGGTMLWRDPSPRYVYGSVSGFGASRYGGTDKWNVTFTVTEVDHA